jgi:methionine-rich copper-binding protein CopC
MLMESLEEIELHFASEVNLIKLELVDRANGESVSLGFKPTTAAATDFSQPLPALKIGTYQVNWAAMGADGHKMEGDFSFMMHVESDAGAMMHPDSDQMHGAEASQGESSHSGH